MVPTKFDVRGVMKFMLTVNDRLLSMLNILLWRDQEGGVIIMISILVIEFGDAEFKS